MGASGEADMTTWELNGAGSEGTACGAGWVCSVQPTPFQNRRVAGMLGSGRQPGDESTAPR